MAHVSRTRYAPCGDMDIAYQVIGEGPHDLVLLPGALISIDSIAAEPSLYHFHRRLASFSRVIRLDHRGTGLSSRLSSPDVMAPEFWAEDVIAVMDAVGCEKATIFMSSYATMIGLVVAADYPERVRGLVIVNGAARFLSAPDYPFGADLNRAAQLTTVAMDTDAVDRGVDVLGLLAPTVAGVEAFRTWWDEAGNRAASPSMARAVGVAAVKADQRGTLARVTAPTLILHRGSCSFVPVGHGRYLAEHIANSRYIELPGVDTLYWVGDSAPLLDEIEEFVTGVRGAVEADRVVATVVFTDIVGSTARAAALGDRRWRELLDNHDNVIRHQLQRFGGREVNTAGDGFVATFASPSRAIDCAEAIVDAVHPMGIEVRVGIHAGEVEMRGADVAGMAVHIGARVAALAAANEVLVSSTVRELVTGSRRVFHERGQHELKGVQGRWCLYAI